MALIRRSNHEKKTDFLWITLGTLLLAVATNLFFSPAHMVPGGFTGLAMILRKAVAEWWGYDLPIWAWNIILNVPLILLSVLVRGWGFIKRTFLASLMFSGWLYLIPEYLVIKDDLFLVTVVGGALMGFSLGIIFLGKATTGGTDTLAALIQKALPHLSIAKILPVLDTIIILLAIWIFGFNISLYAIISVVIMNYIADHVIAGARNSIVAYIVSDAYKEIGVQVMEEMDRGATLLNATGMYTGSEKPVIFVAVSPRQQVILKEIVYGVDPNAFMILADASEVRGEGFLKFTKDEL